MVFFIYCSDRRRGTEWCFLYIVVTGGGGQSVFIYCSDRRRGGRVVFFYIL